MNSARFQVGSGAYQCGSCGRTTRFTGDRDAANNRRCAECWELGGIENELLDTPKDSARVAELQAEIDELKIQIAKKGGKVQ